MPGGLSGHGALVLRYLLDHHSAAGSRIAAGHWFDALRGKALDRSGLFPVPTLRICEAGVYPLAGKFSEPAGRRIASAAGLLESLRPDVIAFCANHEGAGSWLGPRAVTHWADDVIRGRHSQTVPPALA